MPSGMELYYNPRSALLFVALVQGTIYTLLLCVRAYRLHRMADLALAGFLLLITCSLIEYCIGFLGVYDLYPAIWFFPFDHPLAYAPCIWVFVQAILVQEVPGNIWRWFVPAGLHAILQLLVFSLPAEIKNTYIESYHFPWVAGGLYVLALGFSGWILVLCMRLLRQYRRTLAADYAHITEASVRWLRYFLVAYLIYLLFDAGFTAVGTLFDFGFEDWWWLYFTRACLLYYLCFAVYQFKEEVALPRAQLAPSGSGLALQPVTDQDHILRQTLDQYMHTHKPYLQETLTLQSLARLLDTPANRISFVINHILHKNFNDWVNEYRVAEVIRHLQDPAKSNHKLLSLAFESGFGSKTTFNRVFRKVTGQSPSAYSETLRQSRA